jgi:hypothetical protein
MEDFINKLFAYLADLSATVPYLETTLATIGGFVVAATVLKPVVYWIVARTETDKDDIFANRLYLFLDSCGIALGQLVGVFKRKYPEAAALAGRMSAETKGTSHE